VPPDNDKQSKTERASSYKLRRSREQGQVAKSQDLSATVTFIVTFVMIAIYSPKICSEINLVFRQIFFDYDLNSFNELSFQRVTTFFFKELRDLFLSFRTLEVSPIRQQRIEVASFLNLLP